LICGCTHSWNTFSGLFAGFPPFYAVFSTRSTRDTFPGCGSLASGTFRCCFRFSRFSILDARPRRPSALTCKRKMPESRAQRKPKSPSVESKKRLRRRRRRRRRQRRRPRQRQLPRNEEGPNQMPKTARSLPHAHTHPESPKKVRTHDIIEGPDFQIPAIDFGTCCILTRICIFKKSF